MQMCNLPSIIFKGDTAHNYAAVYNKLGNYIELGAVSEHNIAMSYAHKSGLQYATQFYPEHKYHINTHDINHQKALLENFVNLTMLHSQYRNGEIDHPERLLEQISNRLHEYLESPNSLAGELALNDHNVKVILDQWFNY